MKRRMLRGRFFDPAARSDGVIQKKDAAPNPKFLIKSRLSILFSEIYVNQQLPAISSGETNETIIKKTANTE